MGSASVITQKNWTGLSQLHKLSSTLSIPLQKVIGSRRASEDFGAKRDDVNGRMIVGDTIKEVEVRSGPPTYQQGLCSPQIKATSAPVVPIRKNLS